MKRLGIITLILALVMLATACGGGPGINKQALEQKIMLMTQEQAPDEVIQDVQCVEDDGNHYTCLIDATMSDGTPDQLTVKASCDDSGGGTCVWRPEG